MATYNEKQRKEYATVGSNRFPIGDKAHARLALAMINRGGLSKSEKAKVRAKADKMLYSDGAIHYAAKMRGR